MKYTNQTFEDFLEDYHFELYPQTLDDDLPDAFEAWITEQDVSEIMELAELYGKSQYLSGKEEILNIEAKRLSVNND